MTVKELLQSACGENRNMTTFAEEISQDIPVSASTLYRLAAGETRKAIPAELLQAIIKHADPNSTVTFDELETAFRSQCRTVSRSRRMSKALLMENLAKAAIFETALDCGAAVSKASPIIADPKTGEKRIYDSALLLKRDDVNDYYQKRIQNPQSYKYSGFEASLDVSKMIPDTYMTYIYYETGNLKVLDPVEHNIYL